MTRITLSLVSHTNVGKTTLARTLLRADVGEVRDAPHVTEFAAPYRVLATATGDELWLWDTPGFGDSARLARRMRQAANPLGWLLAQVWDRFADRPFWASQQALRCVRERADVVLYLVNAAEPPESAGYVAPEMDLLGWLGKPVIVLLNQLGLPRPAAEEAADVDRWRQYLDQRGKVGTVLAFDAFARCWVQEGTLLAAIAAALPGDRQGAMERLQAAWQAARRQGFEASMTVIARSLAVLALDRQPVDDGSFLGSVRTQLREIGSRVRGDPASGPVARAEQLLAEGLDREVRTSTARLIALHGLEGEARDEVLDRLAARYDLRLRVDEGQAAMVGGVVTGALAGLKADLATGGLTLGGGLLAGSLLGALGGLGVARLVNQVRGTGQSWVTWNAGVLDSLAAAALLRYLAVAHFGRGRGEWRDSEVPPHWPGVVDRALAPHRDSLAVLWAGRPAGGDVALEESVTASLASRLEPLLAGAAKSALQELYGATGW